MTEQTYLTEPDTHTTQATCVEVQEAGEQKIVILDKTIFYSQGGGQPADTGVIETGTKRFLVYDVRINEEEEILHYGTFETEPFQKNEPVTLIINKEKRIQHTNIHSAGHLIDCAIEDIGLTHLKATKGYHFPQGTYVEYEGSIEDTAQVKEQLEEALSSLREQNIPLTIRYISSQEAKHKGILLKQGAEARMVAFQGYEECGCAGTHVKTTAQLPEITIRKITSKKGRTKISYLVGA